MAHEFTFMDASALLSTQQEPGTFTPDAPYLPTYGQVAQLSTSLSEERSTLRESEPASSNHVDHDDWQDGFGELVDPATDVLFGIDFNEIFGVDLTEPQEDSQQQQDLPNAREIYSERQDERDEPQLAFQNRDMMRLDTPLLNESAYDINTVDPDLRNFTSHQFPDSQRDLPGPRSHSPPLNQGYRKRGREDENDFSNREEDERSAAKRQKTTSFTASRSTSGEDHSSHSLGSQIEVALPTSDFDLYPMTSDAQREFERVRAEGRFVDLSGDRSYQDLIRAAIEPLQRIRAFPYIGDADLNSFAPNRAGLLQFLKRVADFCNEALSHHDAKFSYSLGICRQTRRFPYPTPDFALYHSDPSEPMSHSIWFEEFPQGDGTLTLLPFVLPSLEHAAPLAGVGAEPLEEQEVLQVTAGANSAVDGDSIAVTPRTSSLSVTATANVSIPASLDVNGPAVDPADNTGNVASVGLPTTAHAPLAGRASSTQQLLATASSTTTMGNTSQPAALPIFAPLFQPITLATTASAAPRRRSRRALIHIGVDMSPWQGLEPRDLLFMVAEGMVAAKDVSGEYAYEMCKECTNEECAAAITKQTGQEFDPNNFWQRVVKHLSRKVGSSERGNNGALRKAIDALQDERIENGLKTSEGFKR